MLHHRQASSPTPMPPRRDVSSLVSKYSQEIPATAPVFEGHLYLRTEKKQWQWRLFRFDGSSFTCLSTRKVKLPPNTAVDVQDDLQFSFMHASPSYASLTSPLLATPKESLLHETAPLASYYQLPIFTVDVTNISAVSLLKRSKKSNGLFSSSARPSRCFCIRTFDDQCYVMKAQKQKDLERWVFVLTKMLQFAQAIRRQLTRQSVNYSSSLMNPTKTQDHGSLTRITAPPNPAIPAIALMTSPLHVPNKHDTMTYEQKYQTPALSSEKKQWIDEWRKSLAELIAYDPNIKVSPPPIEPIPDDDKMSMLSGMTSVSKRERPRRRSTAGSLRSYKSLSRRVSTVSMHEKEMREPRSGKLKKKRSDDVKNWIEPVHHVSKQNDIKRSTSQQSVRLVRSMNRKPMIQRVASIRTPSSSPEIYDIDFFQDVATTYTRESEPRSKLPTIRYHSSVRGKHVQVVHGHDNGSSDSKPRDKKAGSISRRASMPLEGFRNLIGDEDPLCTMSPLQSLSKTENAIALMAEKKEDEEMSLADLQRNLKRAHRRESWGHTRSPSASTILDIQKLQQRQQQPTLMHIQQTYPFACGSAFAAPAVPPVNIPVGEPSCWYLPMFDTIEKENMRVQHQRGKLTS
ncbi:hypothetical protein EC973_001536 [Apophysomyces ossiformis]|uniref:PH domain-containing protein n=1 Tax=Apophysomyces ossiformis TaxID=679940 RepID=A0A8H7EP93_9FUNG|nr:hypothetical protein EC973_001536 [Apophysomyces ossiformis]